MREPSATTIRYRDSTRMYSSASDTPHSHFTSTLVLRQTCMNHSAPEALGHRGESPAERATALVVSLERAHTVVSRAPSLTCPQLLGHRSSSFTPIR
jgi:hypothetical protein